jgi:hypothetical protein
VISWASPRPATIRISVAMIGCRPTTETRKPFQTPSSSARPSAIAQATSTPDRLPWSSSPAMCRQASAPATDITEPTDRSMPPVAMTRVMPTATRISGALSRRMSIRLPYRWPWRSSIEKKLGVNSRLPSSSTTSASAGQNNRCFSRAVTGRLRWRWSS